MANSAQSSLLEEFIKANARTFKRMVLRYYPITDALLKQSFDKNTGNAIIWEEISRNETMTWTKEFITKYTKKLDWDVLSTNHKIVQTEGMIDFCKDYWRWNYLCSNTGLTFTKELIEKFESKLDFVELSQNPSAQFTEELLIKYGKKLSWKHIRLNPGIKWTRDMIDRVREGTGNEDIIPLYLTAAEGMAWSDKDLEEFKTHESAPMAWDNLSANDGLPWSMELYKKYQDFWYLNRMCKLRKFPWTEQFITKYADKLDWWELGGNPAVPFTEALIKKFEKKWTWQSTGRDEWALSGLSGNPSLPWSEKFIDTWITKWSSRTITLNPALPWSIEFINKYKDKLKLWMNDLHRNKGIWDKAIKPFLTENLIIKVMAKYFE